MTKKRATYYLHRIYRLLEDDEFVSRFRKLRNFKTGGRLHIYEGVAIDMTNFVDPRKAQISTLCLHEPLHSLYPDMPEAEILHLECEIGNALSMRQWANLQRRVANIVGG